MWITCQQPRERNQRPRMPYFLSPAPSPVEQEGDPSERLPPALLLTEDMNEVIPNVWVGNLAAASNGDALRKNGISSVVSAVRGQVNLPTVSCLSVLALRTKLNVGVGRARLDPDSRAARSLCVLLSTPDGDLACRSSG